MLEPAGTLPWTHSCFVCGEGNSRGLRLTSRVEGDAVVVDYTPVREDVGYRNLVHGGISMTLLDEVMTWAAILSVRRACVAAEVTTRLKRPVRVGQALRIEGRVERAGGKLIATSGVIRDADGAVLVVANGKYLPMPVPDTTESLKDFVPGSGDIAVERIFEPDAAC